MATTPISTTGIAGRRRLFWWQARVLFLLTGWIYAPIVSRLIANWFSSGSGDEVEGLPVETGRTFIWYPTLFV